MGALSEHIDVTTYPFLPSSPGVDYFSHLVQIFSGFDIVVVQRCYMYDVVRQVKDACEFVGIPMVFETDDDYLHLPPDNPAYLSMIPKAFMDSKPSPEDLEKKRIECLLQYIEIISFSDLVTVSTEELKRTLNMYNKNIEVLQNNIEQVWEYRDHLPESAFITDGRFQVAINHGLYSLPDHCVVDNKAFAVPRVGYSGTLTHRGNDFNTIKYYWEKFVAKHSKHAWFVYLGDKYFWDEHDQIAKSKNLPNRHFNIPQSQYDLYMLNYRNIDIGMAPLYNNVFNMSKSDIKAVEAAAWGIPCVLPNYVTYTRNFKHGENCLIYNNGKEFYDCLEALVTNAELRHKLGSAAFTYVRDNRIEKQHSARRLEIYKKVIDKSYRMHIFAPGGESEPETTREPSYCEA